jgi:Domain of unknown function (DUF1772)
LVLKEFAMMPILQIVSIVLVAVGVALSLAHALEFPGKLRLPRETYFAVQAIYYPGFTIGGVFGELGAMVATLALLLVTPFGTPEFWLTLTALVLLLVMHGVYWVVTHPVNKVWLKDYDLKGAGKAFFETGAARQSDHDDDTDWRTLRDRWEYSHMARAVLALLSLIALASAAVL